MTAISGLILVSSVYTVFGNKRIHTFSTIVGNGADTFPSGGIQCPPSNFGLKTVEFVDIDGGEFQWTYDYANQKVNAYDVAATTSGVAALACNGAVPTSGVYIRLRAQGTGLG